MNIRDFQLITPERIGTANRAIEIIIVISAIATLLSMISFAIILMAFGFNSHYLTIPGRFVLGNLMICLTFATALVITGGVESYMEEQLQYRQ